MLEPFASEFTPYLEYLNKTSNLIIKLIKLIPGSDILIRYVKSSHQNDPFRTFLELSLVFFIIRTWRQSRTRGDVGSGKSFVKLTEKEIDELIAEWKPEPLVETAVQTTQLKSQPPIIVGIPGVRAKILHGQAAKKFIESPSHDSPIDPKDLKEVTNLASINFAGLIGNEDVKHRAIEQLRRSGVGSCGPPGFYGTFDVHMELERDIADFLGLQNSIIYAQGFSTTSSVIPSFSKRGDIIVVDRGVNFSIQKGIQISRSTIRWYDHNDIGSLEKVLEQLKFEEIKYRRKLTRKFIITEALFESDGQICDLPAIIKLKEKFKFRLILDETWSIGSLGKTGRGLTEYFGVPPKSVDILVGSLATSFNSGGGFCAGSNEVVSHQRINSAALVFSAALPPLLATAASESIKILSEGDGVARFERLRKNTRLLREVLKPITGHPMSEEGLIEIPSHEASPLIHITLKSSPQQQPPLSATSTKATPNNELSPHWSPRQLANQALPSFGTTMNMRSYEEQEELLQKIVDLAIEEKNVLITRTKKVWEQEIDPMSPSLRICVSEALHTDELIRAANSLVEVFKKVLVE
ncbi:serine palmitoyltransferase component [Puccinia graminis f. sp. tritici]|uniref:serine C-palmitoyltransferase n=1 Tax=Puccinia graminis f. sp. tritici TaxID=56615 RepID=A0A5B0R767_PUCGR|nr:serine palmitoyltransferase component [Puccinia graminis f. sp. tritici]